MTGLARVISTLLPDTATALIDLVTLLTLTVKAVFGGTIFASARL